MLKGKLQSDLKESLKSGNTKKRMVIGGIMSAIKNRELDKRGKLSKTGTPADKLDEESKLDDEEILEVVASEAKKRKESIESFRSGGREDLVTGEKEELDILMTYMPEQMSEDAVREEVKKAIAEIHSTGSGQAGAKDIKDMGKVISAVMAKIKGKAEGSLVSRLVKEELAR